MVRWDYVPESWFAGIMSPGHGSLGLRLMSHGSLGLCPRVTVCWDYVSESCLAGITSDESWFAEIMSAESWFAGIRSLSHASLKLCLMSQGSLVMCDETAFAVLDRRLRGCIDVSMTVCVQSSCCE